jgi:multisubunit Na+/H+ antiporter MnhF subunit
MVVIIYVLIVIYRCWGGGVLFWNVAFCLSLIAGVGVFVYEKHTVIWELIAYSAICAHICRDAIDRVSKE